MDTLLIPAFVAGVIIFFAPCTLPLVPAYLGFLTGVSGAELRESAAALRKKAVVQSLLFAAGFTVVFMAFGLAFGLGGAALVSHRTLMTRIAGVFIILFGALMLRPNAFAKLRFLQKDTRPRLRFLRPGKPLSAFLFGASFSLGWTPCIGPILGSVLVLAASSLTAARGALLLFVFSLGLAVPFVAVALGIGHTAKALAKWAKHMRTVEAAGGAMLMAIGLLMAFDKTSLWTGFAYEHLQLFKYEQLLDYL